MQEETPHAAQAWKTVDKHILAKKISNHPPNPESSDGPGTVTVTFPTHAAVREIRCFQTPNFFPWAPQTDEAPLAYQAAYMKNLHPLPFFPYTFHICEFYSKVDMILSFE